MDSSTKGKSVSESDEDDITGASENGKGGTNIPEVSTSEKGQGGTSYFWSRIQRVITEKATLLRNVVEDVISPTRMDRRRTEQWNLWFHLGEDNFRCLIASRDGALLEHIRHGIPCSLRSHVWSLLLGSDRLQLDHPGLFQELINREADLDIECKKVIQGDYRRCKFFKTKLTQEPLRKILVAYTLYNEKLKYTQGMGLLAGLLLVQLNNLEQTFWAYVALMEGYSAGGTRMMAFFDELSSEKALLKLYIEHLNELLQMLVPDLWARLDKEGLDCFGFAQKWFVTIFASFPLHFNLRIWDVVLLEGYEIVFYVAVAVLKHHEKELLQMRDSIQFTNTLPLLDKLFPMDGNVILPMAFALQANHPMPSHVKQTLLPC